MTHTTKYEKKNGKTNKVKSEKNEASSGALGSNPGANNPGKEGDKK
jgi:hypothetical protein